MPNDDAAMPPDSDPSLVDPVDWAAVERHVAGEGTAAGRQALEAWIAEAPDRIRLVEAVRAFRTATRAARPRFDTNTAWTAAQTRIGEASASPSTSSQLTSGPRVVHRDLHLWPRGVVGGAWRWAALATSVVVLGIGLAIGSLVHHASVRSLGREYATVAGQRLSVTLVDGTQLTLAPASRLRIAVDYGRLGSGREVELEGEAYFAVTHDAAHPFAVGAHGVVTRDVGTVFDVRAYPEDAGARIGVVEGAVAVSTAAACQTGAGGQGAVGARAARPPSSDAPDEGCGAQVRAGDVATVVNDKVAVEHGVDVASLTEWTAGRLVFDRTPMTTVVAEVSRWYGIDVRLGDPALAAQAFSATLTTESARDAVAVLADALRLRVETRGPATFTLYRLGA